MKVRADGDPHVHSAEPGAFYGRQTKALTETDQLPATLMASVVQSWLKVSVTASLQTLMGPE